MVTYSTETQTTGGDSVNGHRPRPHRLPLNRTPFLYRREVSPDPTPFKSLFLEILYSKAGVCNILNFHPLVPIPFFSLTPNPPCKCVHVKCGRKGRTELQTLQEVSWLPGVHSRTEYIYLNSKLYTVKHRPKEVNCIAKGPSRLDIAQSHERGKSTDSFIRYLSYLVSTK